MVRIARGAFLALILLAGAGARVQADDPEGKVFLWLRPGWRYTELSAANDAIGAGNQVFESNDFSTLGSFHDTFYLGVDVNVNVSQHFVAYAGIGTEFGSKNMSFNRVIETSVKGTPITAGLLWRVPWLRSWEDALDDLDLYFGAGLVYMSNFEFTALDDDLLTQNEFREERVFTGTGAGGEIRLNLEYFLTPRFTLMGGFSWRYLSVNNMDHAVSVVAPNVFNPLSDDDGDGLQNQFDPDYDEGFAQGRGPAQRMYGSPVDEDGEQVWRIPRSRYFQSLYKYDSTSYSNWNPVLYPSAIVDQLRYDQNASFDMDLSGIGIQIGLNYYMF